ncbi:uncharacterized protein VTP21DRAFT_3735 [Calcarisporiella thermophila]|uniref:uncharacterized protein n=1 Tax=Calcarisporiella thermophila TaxID=911321 RepID=UPI0037436FEB
MSAPSENRRKDIVLNLVLDTAAFVRQVPLRHLAQNFVTIPEVLAEVRDERAREYLNNLPFKIQVRTPTEEAVKAVVSFSKKTGDFPSLSMVDLKVLALAYMVEVECNGTRRLRTEPQRPKTFNGPKPRQNEKVETTETVAPNNEEEISVENQETNDNEEAAEAEDQQEQIEKKKEEEEEEEEVEVVVENENQERDSKEEHIDNAEDIVAESVDSITSQINTISLNGTTATSEIPDNTPISTDTVKEVNEDEIEDDDEGEWITPDNVHQHKEKAYGLLPGQRSSRRTIIKSACMTGDFAMQNVILQMGMNLLSVDGLRIRRLKSYVLRCHACYKITTDMERKFCQSCGNATLIRTSCTVDEHGNVTYYLKKDFKYNLRGTKYSIPDPKGGRWQSNKDLLLREDQVEYQRELKRSQRAKEKALKSDVFDPDYIPSLISGTHSNLMGPTIGYGRKNPNERRRTGNKKKKNK